MPIIFFLTRAFKTIFLITSLLVFILLTSCNSQSTEEKKQLQRNLKGEFIYRHHNEILFAPPMPRKTPREAYPWEETFIGQFPKITKEFFRCRGNTIHTVKVIPQEGKEPMRYFDCGGAQRHGLPLDNDREFIYPCLIEILNYLQEKTKKRIIITSGHRCPQHNLYCDASKNNWASKHLIGAEVDFYVEGLEEKPLEVVQLIQNFYKEKPLYKNKKEYEQFARYEKEGCTVSTPPWFNKEIFIKLHKKYEGRNFDNIHPFPYLSIQVRHDRDLNTAVTYDAKKAQNFKRY